MKISKIGLEGTYNLNQVKQKIVTQKQIQRIQTEKRVKEGIELSTKNEIKKYKELIKNIPEIREEKVKELKNAIEQGNYKIEATKVANKMLEDIILGAK